MTAPRRVVVTGVGLVCPLGNSLAATGAALARGDRAFSPPTVFDASGFSETLGGEVKDFDARAHFRVTKALKLTDRAARFAVAAAGMAVADAAWPEDDHALERLGVVVGSCGSDLQTPDLAAALRGDPGLRAVRDIPYFAGRVLEGLNPLWLLISLPNMASAHVAIQLRAKGPNSTIMTDWAAGSQAIGEAFEWIRWGEADAVLAGGADSGLSPFAYIHYQTAGLFEAAAEDGAAGRFVPAEGAAILLLEEREHARTRGAAVRGEVCAYASASAPIDARASALAATMRGAIADAGWAVGDVEAISTATVFAAPYQALERRALAAAFAGAGPHHTELTSRLGHALGAAGAIDAALSIALGQGARLCSAIGLSGQAVTLAFHDGHQREAPRP